MKKVLLTLLAFMATVAMNAERVSKQQALQKAQQFMPGKQFGEARSFARSAGSSEGEPFYVFNADDNGGFVIVSGDDRTTEILGYSNNGTLDMEQLPDHLKWWLDSYARQIDALGTSAKPAQKVKTRGADKWEAVDPLIKTQWNQNYPYNLMCPDWSGKDWRDPGFDTDHLMTNYQTYYHCVTGCVAVAMAQVIYYWKCLDDCPAITGYKTSTYGWTMKALPATTFKWAQMQKTYSGDETGASAEAVAELFRYCGQAVEMDYNLGGSSASITPADMANYFGFSNNAKLVIRSMYSSSEWENMIYKDISENRPVIYGGSSMSGGHQFIVDGYDGNGLFHMNWGWGGMSDGYFVLSLANPDELGAGGGTSSDGYSMDQNAIIGLKPATTGEVEIPQFYGKFSDKLVNSEFNRASSSEDFTDVVFPGLVFFQYENTDQTGVCTFETAWGLYQNGNLLKVLGVSEPNTLKNNIIAYNWPTISFGSDLPDGQYQFRQMYRLQGSTEWQLCKSPYDNYYGNTIVFIEAIVSGNNLTLRKSELDEYSSKITVNSVSFYPTSLENGKPLEVTVNLTNNGDSYQELVYLSLGSQKTVVCGSVEAGQTGNVKLYLTPAQVGTMTLKISTDYYAKNEVWSKQVTVEAAKPQLLSATATTPGLVNNVLTGTTLKVNAIVKNEGSNTYENSIVLTLFKNTEDPSSGMIGGPLVTTKSEMATIQTGKIENVNFVVEGLDIESEYFYYINYFSAGYEEDLEITPEIDMYFSLTEEKEDEGDPDPTPVSGDADGNGMVEAADIDAVVKYIMEGDFEGFNLKNADLNGDNKVDAADLVLLIKMLQS